MVYGRFAENFMVAAKNRPDRSFRSLPQDERSWILVALQAGAPDGGRATRGCSRCAVDGK
jgi:hypothetical protein